MGDSERRRARERDRLRRSQISGDVFWDALDQISEEALNERQNQQHNEHVMRMKKNKSERNYRLRKKRNRGRP